MSTTTIDRPPERSLEQRREALRTANRIRVYRAGLKREVAADWQRAARAITDVEPDLATMKVAELLLAVEKVGRTRVNRMLRAERVSPYKTIGGLTARQRAALVLELAREKNGRVRFR